MSFSSSKNYAPPGVYSQSEFETPIPPVALESLKIPVFIGEGNEYLVQRQLEIVRGSSATADQRIVMEDETNRMVVDINAQGAVTLGGFDGVLDRFQVAHYPITSGDGTGRSSTNRTDVVVTLNNQPVVVRSVEGARGIVQIAQPPQPGDILRCTYYFKRTDTLITDDLSDQVSPGRAVVRGLFGIGDVNATNPTVPPTVLDIHDDIKDINGVVIVPANNVLTVTVDGVTTSIKIPARSNYTMAQVASAITAARVETLEAVTVIDNYGLTTLQLMADNSLVILEGSANGLLGLVKGQQDIRTATFYTFQGPIVTGSGGGITATDPSQVTVKVNGIQVIPTAVDGTSRAVTLAVAPAAGSTVTVTYYFNTWQDTFDYLAHINVSEVVSCGDSPGSTAYAQDTDFILQNDKILWGTAVTVESGIHTEQSSYFGSDQVSTLLVDNRTFLTECAPVVSNNNASQTTFRLPYEPTLGNGRDTPLGQSLFQTVSNSRIDLPVNRPDVVWAYWGWDAQDALERGRVQVLKVEGSVITLAEPVPVGARLFATFYHNTLTDETFILECANPGPSGIGTYTIAKGESNTPVYGATFTPSSKGVSLNGVVLSFPSGSELTPDVHFEGVSGSKFTGPVNETVTVQLASRQATPAKFSAPGAGPYEFIKGFSDHLRLSVHNSDLGTSGIDLDNPSEWNGGFFASLVGNEVQYANGMNFDIGGAEEVLLTIDGVDVLAKTRQNMTAVDITAFANAINEAAGGHQGKATTTEASDTVITLPVNDPGSTWSNVDGYYVGWKVVVGNHSLGGAIPGDETVIMAYNGISGVATVSPAFSGNVAENTPIYVYKPDYRSALAGATAFSGPVQLASGKHDRLSLVYHGSTTPVTPLNIAVAKPTAVAKAVVTVGAVSGGEVLSIAGVDFTYDGSPDPSSQTFKDAATLIAAINDGVSQGLLLIALDHGTESVTASAGQANEVVLTYTVTGHHGLEVTLETSDSVNLVISGETLEFGSSDYQFPTVNDLANGIQSALDIAVSDAVIGLPDLAGLKIECAANAESQVEFRLQLPGLESSGYLQFVDNASDFAVLAGLDTALNEGGGQAALLQGPVAKTYKCPATGALKPYDRLILRNRIMPGGGPESSMNADSIIGQTGLVIKSASGLTGLDIGMEGLAERTATVKPASIASKMSLANGFDSDAELITVFYDNSGTKAANNGFVFTLDGHTVNVTFVGSGSGVVTPIGPATSAGTDSVIDQIQEALANVAGSPFGNRTQIFNSKIVRQEGCGIRITGLARDTAANVVIQAGSANGVLGLSAGKNAYRKAVPVKVLASALNAHRNSVSFTAYVNDFASNEALKFATYGLASVVYDDSGLEYLYVQDAPTQVVNLGSASNLSFHDADFASALNYGTLLGIVDGDGASGQPAINGFFVVSDNPVKGSGSINNSILNPGVGHGGIGQPGSGQDGIVGQTYRDAVTGLTFTLLPRGFQDNPTGPWVAYPTGPNATFQFEVGNVFKTNANIPHLAINGCELKVSNTVDIYSGDTANVTTFERGGNEPDIGDLYYVDYIYQKQDFSTGFYRSLSAIERAFGPATPDNPLSLAAYLAIINGAVIVGLKQVPREQGSNYASLDSYRDAIKELEGVLPGNVKPDIVTPLRGDSTQLYQLLKKSNEIQSSIRYKSERTSIVGMAAGSLPVAAGNLAQNLSHSRMRLVYPDLAIVTLQDSNGVSRDHLVDGPFIAAALAGSIVSPNMDVATPWTGRRLVGFTQLGRRLDAVEQNQLAVKGVTVLEEQLPFLRVRHGMTTDLTSTLTKLPTIIQIADEVQQQARNVLGRFVGVKYLPSILTQVEGRVSMMLKAMVMARIITAYTGVKANISPDNPTMAEIEAFYSPVFPLLYLLVTFHLRSST